ncbi:MAG: CocE/NonD family hydrolase, partial [Acidimicrobiales bacterium]
GPPGNAAGPPSSQLTQLTPTDYVALADTLSQPDFPEVVREVHEVAAHDGEVLYVEVVRPDPAAYPDLDVPVILEASPYHGTLADRDGTRIFPDPVDEAGNPIGLTGYFAPRGYAVAMMDLRGTGRSTGCLDHIGGNDAQDMADVIEYLADQEWSTGRVGMTGHSYVGSTPSAAAARNPRGLVTIVPSAGLASMYDHQFHNGVPWLLQWIGPMVAYEGLALERDLPPETPGLPVLGSGNAGDNWTYTGGPNPQTGCGLPNSALLAGTGQATGQYQDWHADRDWRDGVAAADIPIFMIHGVNDNAARIPSSEWFFGRRFGREGDKVWLGQWDHGSTNGRCGDAEGGRALHPTCRFQQFQYALHAWFDHHLLLRDVDTGPAVEVFLNAETPVDVTEVMDPESIDSRVYAAEAWSEPPSVLRLYPDASDMSLRTTMPTQEATASFATIAEAVLASVGRGSVTFTSEPFAEDTVFLGAPQLQLNASLSTAQIAHLVTTLWRVDAEGNREPVNFCAIQPQLRNGVDTVTPVVPLEEMELPLQCFTAAHWVPAGQRLELEVSTGSQHHASFGDTDPLITVHTGPDRTRYDLPAVPDAVLHDDVPLRDTISEPVPVGPAQPPIAGSVVVPAPGAGLQLEPLTAAGFEFDILDGFDNARLEVVATPLLPADVDLYLQRWENGEWSDDLATAESESLESETLTSGRHPPGHYRIVVHNWLGPPNEVSLSITFFNQDDEPGS